MSDQDHFILSEVVPLLVLTPQRGTIRDVGKCLPICMKLPEEAIEMLLFDTGYVAH